MRIVVPDIGPSFNSYQNMHYKPRGELVRKWNAAVGWIVKSEEIEPITTYPITIHCRCVFGKGRRTYDWVNLSVTAKLIEDALRHAGILAEDSKKFISWGKLEAVKMKGDTYTEFIITSE